MKRWKTLEAVILGATIYMLAAMLHAQDVPFTKVGVGWNPAGPFYSDDGRFVIWQSDFGFFWLDTQLLTPGQVQAEAKCGFPVGSASNYYSIGDCNGIGSVRTSGAQVEALSAGGNCAARPGCPPTGNIATRWFFALPNMNYLKASNSSADDIPVGKRTSDSLGRQWQLQPITAGHFNWHGIGGSTPTPAITPTPTATNTPAPGTPTVTPNTICLCLPVTVTPAR